MAADQFVVIIAGIIYMEPIQPLSNDITLDAAMFILEREEKRMQATIDLTKMLTDRALNVLQFSIPLALVLIGLITAGPGREILGLYVVSLILSIVISLLGFKLYDYNVQILETKPAGLVNSLNVLPKDKYEQLELIFSAIEIDQKVIELNEASNLQRQGFWFCITLLLKVLILLPCVYIPMALHLL